VITIADATFETLDALNADALALFISSERRVLRGAAGLVDWRMGGAVSRSLLDSGFVGNIGDRLLMPTHGRIGPPRLLLFGAGRTSSNMNSESLASALDAAVRAGFKTLAVQLPANVDPQVAAEVAGRAPLEALIIVGPDEALRARLDAQAVGGPQVRDKVRARK
jgi:hypothetical protein